MVYSLWFQVSGSSLKPNTWHLKPSTRRRSINNGTKGGSGPVDEPTAAGRWPLVVEPTACHDVGVQAKTGQKPTANCQF